MKVNYVLMYGTPYLKYREFETFEDISKFIVNKSIVNYSIFKKIKDDEEVEMIYRDNDIRYLEEKNKKLEEKNKTFEDYNKDLNNQLDKLEEENKKLKEDYYILDKFDDKNIEDYKKLEEENKKLKESIVNLIKDDSDLQLRINKAIEYIENHQLVIELSTKEQIKEWASNFYLDLENILKGSEE